MPPGAGRGRVRSQAGWDPIVEPGSALAAEVWASIDEIGRALQGAERFAGNSHSLAAGRAGHALFHAYRSLATGSEDDADAARDAIDRAIDAAGAEPTDGGLMSGVTGVAWVVRHLGARLVPDAEEIVEPADALLRELLDLADRRGAWNGPFDLMTGLTGVGVYFLEWPDSPERAALVSRVLELLEAAATPVDGGLAWHTPPDALEETVRSGWPDGYYNLGTAHGAPGVLGFLARVVAAGIERERASRLLHDVARWLLARRLPGDPSPGYATWWWPGRPATPARTGWCYGNPGVAACLLAAADVSGESAWRGAATELAIESATRPVERTRVSDAGLCHGSAGLVSLFGRLHRASGDERLRDAGLDWVRRTIALRQPDCAEHAFLTGAAGIGLALLSAVSSVSPDWDRVLLGDIPVQS